MQAILKKDPDKEQTEMGELIWPQEIDAIKNMKTWGYAQQLIHSDKAQGDGVRHWIRNNGIPHTLIFSEWQG